MKKSLSSYSPRYSPRYSPLLQIKTTRPAASRSARLGMRQGWKRKQPRGARRYGNDEWCAAAGITPSVTPDGVPAPPEGEPLLCPAMNGAQRTRAISCLHTAFSRVIPHSKFHIPHSTFNCTLHKANNKLFSKTLLLFRFRCAIMHWITHGRGQSALLAASAAGQALAFPVVKKHFFRRI